MKSRQKTLGTDNLVGESITRLRKGESMTQKRLMQQLQTRGIDMNYSSLSKLEGQTRLVTDKELVALADIFRVSIDDLLHPERRREYEWHEE